MTACTLFFSAVGRGELSARGRRPIREAQTYLIENKIGLRAVTQTYLICDKNRKGVLNMSRRCGMPWLKLNAKSYSVGSKQSEHHGNNKAVMCEALKERWSNDKDLDRTKSKYNIFYGYDSGLKLLSDIDKEIADLSDELRSNGKRGIRKDAITSFAGIVKPDKEVMEHLTPKQQAHFFRDALEILIVKFGTNPKTGKPNIRSAVIHVDEGNIHMHYFGVPYTEDGRLSAKEIFSPKLNRWLNEEFPKLMNKKGWNLELCRDERSYQPEIAKNLNEQELKDYKAQCIAYKRNKRKKHGRTSDEFKIERETEKATMQERQLLQERAKAVSEAQNAILISKTEIKKREQAIEEKETNVSKYEELGVEYFSRAKQIYNNLYREDNEFRANKSKLYNQSMRRIDAIHTRLDESLLPRQRNKKKEKQVSL